MKYELISLPEQPINQQKSSGYELISLPGKEIVQKSSRNNPQDESWGDFGLRTGARTLARGIESIAGLPGDIVSSLQSGLNYLTGTSIPSTEEKRQKEKAIDKRQQELKAKGEKEELTFPEFIEYIKPNVLKKGLGEGELLPTSQAIKEKITKPLTGEHLEPRGKGEKFYDDVISDLSTLALPIKGKAPFIKAAATALGANTASWLAKEAGAGPLGQAGAKMATVIGSNMIGFRRNMIKKQDQLYDIAENVLKPTDVGDATKLNDAIKDISNLKPGHRRIKDFLAPHIEDISKDIHKNKISIQNTWEIKKSLNNVLKNAEVDKEFAKEVVPYIKRLVGETKNILDNFGKNNKAFGQPFKIAEDIHTGLNQASSINKFLQKTINPNVLSNSAAKILIFGGPFAKAGLPGLAKAAAVGYTAKHGVRAFEFLKNSKEAQKEMGKLIAAAVSKSAPLVAKHATNLDKIANKKYPEFKNA